VKVLRRQDIDLERWDTMVWHSENALFYNLSWCLDTLCEDWLVILKDDYHAGIALPIRSKLGEKFFNVSSIFSLNFFMSLKGFKIDLFNFKKYLSLIVSTI